MNFSIAITAIIVGGLCAPLPSIAAQLTGDSPTTEAVGYVKDSVITAKIKAKLAEDKMGTLLHIGVDTDAKGAVSLSGKADSQGAADRAVSIARGTEGVTSVNSGITIVARD